MVWRPVAVRLRDFARVSDQVHMFCDVTTLNTARRGMEEGNYDF